MPLGPHACCVHNVCINALLLLLLLLSMIVSENKQIALYEWTTSLQ